MIKRSDKFITSRHILSGLKISKGVSKWHLYET